MTKIAYKNGQTLYVIDSTTNTLVRLAMISIIILVIILLLIYFRLDSLDVLSQYFNNC